MSCDMTQYNLSPVCVAALSVADAFACMCMCVCVGCVSVRARVRMFACIYVNAIECV